MGIMIICMLVDAIAAIDSTKKINSYLSLRKNMEELNNLLSEKKRLESSNTTNTKEYYFVIFKIDEIKKKYNL